MRRHTHSAPLEPSGNFVVTLLYQGQRGRPTRPQPEDEEGVETRGSREKVTRDNNRRALPL
jgi:hypothetical protein